MAPAGDASDRRCLLWRIGDVSVLDRQQRLNVLLKLPDVPGSGQLTPSVPAVNRTAK